MIKIYNILKMYFKIQIARFYFQIIQPILIIIIMSVLLLCHLNILLHIFQYTVELR